MPRDYSTLGPDAQRAAQADAPKSVSATAPDPEAELRTRIHMAISGMEVGFKPHRHRLTAWEAMAIAAIAVDEMAGLSAEPDLRVGDRG